jgi:hypothetical protein
MTHMTINTINASDILTPCAGPSKKEPNRAKVSRTEARISDVNALLGLLRSVLSESEDMLKSEGKDLPRLDNVPGFAKRWLDREPGAKSSKPRFYRTLSRDNRQVARVWFDCGVGAKEPATHPISLLNLAVANMIGTSHLLNSALRMIQGVQSEADRAVDTAKDETSKATAKIRQKRAARTSAKIKAVLATSAPAVATAEAQGPASESVAA